MKPSEARDFLKGKMQFTPERMMRYIRSRARLSTDEDIEDILQSALMLVIKHFDPAHPDAKLSLYCLSACNKAIAQNLERYHKVELKPKARSQPLASPAAVVEATNQIMHEGQAMQLKALAAGKSFNEEPSTAAGMFRTTSLDSYFDAEDGRQAEEVFGWECRLTSSGSEEDPAARALIKDLVAQVLAELPTELHRTCFLLKYVHGYKREDLIACLKMDAKSIDTVDKKIVRTLKAFKERLDQEESRA